MLGAAIMGRYKRHLIILFAFAAAASMGIGMWRRIELGAEMEAARSKRDRERAAARAQAEEERNLELVRKLAEESATLMPEMLRGVALGMLVQEVKAVRPGMARSTSKSDPQLVIWEEHLPNGAQVLYGFLREAERLLQVQVLSQVPDADAIGQHLSAMSQRYGTPTGVWDCPQTEGVPTRRFTWRKTHVTVADIFLVYPAGASITLFIAPTDTMGNSLQRSRCAPVPRERIAEFPVVNPTALNPNARGAAPVAPTKVRP